MSKPSLRFCQTVGWTLKYKSWFKFAVIFLSSFKSQIRYAHSINMLPSHIKAFDFLFTKDNPESSIMKKSYKSYSRSYLQVPSWATIEMILAENLSKIMDALKFKTYSKDFLKKITNKTASTVDYILSI